ncbi:hypothetical protein [Streptomyces sp. NPDC058701]
MAHQVVPRHRQRGAHAARSAPHDHRLRILLLTFLAVAALLASVMAGL